VRNPIMYTGFVASLCLRNSEEEGEVGTGLFILETESSWAYPT